MADEKVRLHNKGKRQFMLKTGQQSDAGRAIEVTKDVADFYVDAYPNDFILFDNLGTSDNVKISNAKLTKENKKLATEKAALEARIIELESASEDKAKPKTKTKADPAESKK